MTDSGKEYRSKIWYSFLYFMETYMSDIKKDPPLCPSCGNYMYRDKEEDDWECNNWPIHEFNNDPQMIYLSQDNISNVKAHYEYHIQIKQFGDQESILMVCTSRDDIVGSCELRHFDSEVPRLDSVFVTEEFRQCGIAKGMIDTLVAICIGNDKMGISLRVSYRNENAISLYKKCGFFISFEYLDGDFMMSRPLNQI